MKKKWIVLFVISILLGNLTGCSSDSDTSKANNLTAKDGIYTGVGKGRNGDVKVEIELKDDKIIAVNVIEHSETEDIAEPAIEKIPNEILEAQSTDVDVVSGATAVSEAIIDGANAALEEAGIDPTNLKKNETTKEVVIEEVSTEIVVIGAGAAGSAAALTAQQNGGQVILLEKTAKPMGAGTLAGGMFAADSEQQKNTDSEVSKEWLYDKYKEASQGHMNSILVREIIDNAGETVDWLNENGATMKLSAAGSGGGFDHSGNPATLHGYQDGGTQAITNLIENFEELGGKIYYNTPATELIKDEKTKAITGVVAKKDDGSELRISAQKVIIATGGYGGNQEMLDEYLGVPNTKGEIAQNTGDGILMAWDAGAAEFGINTTHYFWQTFSKEDIGKMSEEVGADWFALNTFSSYPNLRVNLDGKRFSDETDATLFSVHGAEIAQQPKQTEFVIFDQKMLNTIKDHGTVAIEDHYGQFKDNPQFYMEFNEPMDSAELIERENTPTDFTPLLTKLSDSGVVFKADSLVDLAIQMDVDSENFSDAVEQYNESIINGEDSLYFSDTNRLIEVSEGPFYAVKFVARNLGTLGGVRINEKIEAVDSNGEVVPNLYVAGADAGGMYGSAYVDFEGGTLGFAYTSGRLAGINSVNSLKK